MNPSNAFQYVYAMRLLTTSQWQLITKSIVDLMNCNREKAYTQKDLLVMQEVVTVSKRLILNCDDADLNVEFWKKINAVGEHLTSNEVGNVLKSTKFQNYISAIVGMSRMRVDNKLTA